MASLRKGSEWGRGPHRHRGFSTWITRGSHALGRIPSPATNLLPSYSYRWETGPSIARAILSHIRVNVEGPNGPRNGAQPCSLTMLGYLNEAAEGKKGEGLVSLL